MSSGVPAGPRPDVSLLHQALIDQLKEAGCIRTPRVEAAFRAIPRHLFLPGVPLEQVYRDEAISTKELDGLAVSSSSQPAIMAFMLEQLEVEPGHRVLEIGAGTGYNAALLAHMAGEKGQVVTVDIDQDLVTSARQHLSAAGFRRVEAVCQDGGGGYPGRAPYDRILLTVGATDLLPAWRDQLRPGGRLVLPLSIRGPQLSIAFDQAGDHLVSVSAGDCGFMMLRGAFAAPETKLELGDHPGLHLCTEMYSLVDVEATYRWLTGSSRDWPTQVRVTPGDAHNLRLWLSLHEPHYCDANAIGAWVARGIVPYLFGWNAGGWKLCCTSGLFGEEGLCLLMRAPGQDETVAEHSCSPEFELSIRGFGRDESLVQRMLHQVRAWDAAGRPSTQKLRLKVYPRDAAYLSAPDGISVQKRWAQLVITGWPWEPIW